MQVGELFATMGIDDKDFVKTLGKTEKSSKDLADFVGKPMPMTVDPTELAKALEKAKGDVGRLKDEIAKQAKLGADTSQLTVDLARAEQIARQAKKDLDFNVKATLDADNSKLDAAAKQALGVLADIDGTTATGEADLDVSGVEASAKKGTNTVLDMIGGWAVAGPVAAAGAGVIIGKALIDGVGEAIGNDQSSGLLAARLGLTGEEAHAAGVSAGHLYMDGYGESFDDAANTIDAVASTLLEATASNGGEIEALSKRALDAAAVYDTSAGDIVNTVGVMNNLDWTFGSEHGFDLINAAAGKTAQKMRGPLLEAVDEYGQRFASFGFTADQGFGIMVAASEKGQWALDATGDALKEFGIRGTDMSELSKSAFASIGLDSHKMANDILAGGDTAKGAFDKTILGLLGIKDPGKQAEQAIALFGTPLEEISKDKIPEFLQAMRDGTNGMGDVSQASETTADNINNNFGSTMTEISRKLNPANLLTTLSKEGFAGVETQVVEGVGLLTGAWDEYGPQVKEAIGRGMEWLKGLWDEYGKPLLEDLKTWWEDTAQPAIGQAAGDALGAAWEWAIGAGKDWAIGKLKDPKWIVDAIIGPLKAAPELLGDGLVAAFGWIADNVPEKAGAVWEAVETWLTETGGKVGEKVVEIKDSFFSWVAGTVTDAPEKLGSIWEAIETWITDTGTKIGEKGPYLAGQFLGWVAATLIDAPVKMGDLALQTYDWIRTFAGEVATKALEVSVSFLGWTADVITAAPGKLLEIGTGILDWIGNLGSSTGEKSGEVADGFLSWIGTAISEWGTKILELDGVVIGWFAGLPGRALEAIGDVGGVLFDTGKAIIQGFIDGIQDSEIIKSLEGALGWVTDKIPDWKGPPGKDAKLLVGAGRLVMGGFIDGIDSQTAALQAQLGRVTKMTAGLGVPSVDLAGGSAYPAGVTGSPWAARGADYGQPLVVQLVDRDGRQLAEQLIPHIRVIQDMSS